MSYRSKRQLSLTELDLSQKSPKKLHEFFLQFIETGMHGICFSAYEYGWEIEVLVNQGKNLNPTIR